MRWHTTTVSSPRNPTDSNLSGSCPDDSRTADSGLVNSEPVDSGAAVDPTRGIISGAVDGVTGELTPPIERADEGPARGTLGMMTDPVFGPYFFGKLLSTAGVWVFNIVAAIIAWDLSHSTLVVGGISVALFAPQLLFAPYSGARADRGNPKFQLVVGRTLVMVGSGSLTVTIVLLGVDGLPGAWPVLVASLLVGLGFVVGGPAQNSLLPTLVRRSELAQAVALNSLPPTIARAGGPVVGAVLLVTTGPAVGFAVTAVTNLAFCLIILWLPLANRMQRAGRHDGTVRAGLKYLRTDPVVTSLLVGTLAVGIGSDPVITLTPALSERFGQGDMLVAILASAFGVGAMGGYAVLKRFRARWGVGGVGTAGLTCLAVGMFLTGVAPGIVVAIVGFVVAGVGFSWSLTGLTTQIYERVPESLRGRMMALWMIAFVGSRPLAAAVSGAIADATSVAWAFVGVALAITVIGVTATTGQRRATT